jgi:hypothetical protein
MKSLFSELRKNNNNNNNNSNNKNKKKGNSNPTSVSSLQFTLPPKNPQQTTRTACLFSKRADNLDTTNGGFLFDVDLETVRREGYVISLKNYSIVPICPASRWADGK